MSEEEKVWQKIRDDAEAVVCDARKLKKSISRWFIALITTIISAIIGVTFLITKVDDNSAHLKFVEKDYAPLWVLSDLQQNNDYMVMEIAATFGASKGDQAKLKEIKRKYADFQEQVLNRIAQQRGGMTNIRRGSYVHVNNNDSGGGSQ